MTMVAKKQNPRIELRRDVHERLKKQVSSKDYQMNEYASRLMDAALAAMEVAEEFAPNLKYISHDADQMIIQDMLTYKHYVLQKRAGKVYCVTDNNFKCIHTKYGERLPASWAMKAARA